MTNSFRELVEEEVQKHESPIRITAVLVYEAVMDQMILLPFGLNRTRAVEEDVTGREIARRVRNSMQQTQDMFFMGHIVVPPFANVEFQHQEPGSLFAYGTTIWCKLDERQAFPVLEGPRYPIPFDPDAEIFPAL